MCSTSFRSAREILTVDRLKKVQGKKKRDAEASEALRKKLEEEAAEVHETDPIIAGGGGDLLGSKDEDVIF